LDPALLRPGRIDRKIQYYLATKAQAEALFIKFYPASHTTLNTELSTSSSDPNVVSEKPPVVMNISERQSTLVELAKEFASHVPEHEFSTAELQGYLLMCRKSLERAVSGISEWVEVERKDRKERKENEEERKRRSKEKKEAKEAERLQDSLTRIGGTVVIAPPGPSDASLSTVSNGEGGTGTIANASPPSPVLTTEASSEPGRTVSAADASTAGLGVV
jgi:chaperone BCS1